eukprot:scaffold84846_cov72-Cyclotella_meneghiniana.AAC.3
MIGYISETESSSNCLPCTIQNPNAFAMGQHHQASPSSVNHHQKKNCTLKQRKRDARKASSGVIVVSRLSAEMSLVVRRVKGRLIRADLRRKIDAYFGL